MAPYGPYLGAIYLKNRQRNNRRDGKRARAGAYMGTKNLIADTDEYGRIKPIRDIRKIMAYMGYNKIIADTGFKNFKNFF